MQGIFSLKWRRRGRVAARGALQTGRVIFSVTLGAMSLPALINVSFSQESLKSHPVAISKNQVEKADFCLGCHRAIKGKSTHTAIKSMGCVSCHEVKTEGGKTTIGLVAEGRALCLMCHDDKNTATAKGRIHSPVVDGECSTCHSPHSSDHKFQLLQATAGGKSENLCLMCHEIGTQSFPKGSRHAAMDMGCETCHVTHKTGEPKTLEYAYHLVQAVPSLCLTCHDAKSKEMLSAHRNQPVSQANCVGCHDPHASEQPKLIYNFVHPPFVEKQCDSCHEAPSGEKVSIVEQGRVALCLMCHEEAGKKVNASRHVHGVFTKEKTCTVCHSPHASPYPSHLKQTAADLCNSCHQAWVQEREKKKFVHAPLSKEGCAVCHEPHGTNNTAHLRADVDELCLSCHARDARGEAGSNSATLILFGDSVRLPGNYLAQVMRIPVRQGSTMGHPQLAHPLAGVADPTKPGRKMSCVSCHDPHSGNGSVRMFVTDTKSSSPLCIRCHK